MKEYSLREYLALNEIVGPLFIIRNIHNVGYNEVVEVVDNESRSRFGITLEVGRGYAVVQDLAGPGRFEFL